MKKTLTAILALALAQSALPRDIVATNSVDTVFTWHVNDLQGGGVEITGIDPKPVLEFEVPAAFSTENQTFPVKRIGNGAFANSIGMTSVTLPSTLERIGDSAFANCTSLASVTIPYGVREIGKRPFVNTVITGLALPDSIIKLDGNIAAGALFDLGNALSDSSHFLVTADGAVYNRDQTRLYASPTRTEGTLALPESLTEIGADAFFGCFRLTYLNIPASVTNIGETAFNVAGIWPGLDAPESSAKFKTLIFNGDPPEVADNTFDGTPADLSILTFSTNWPKTWKGYTVTILDPSDPNLPTLEYTDINGLKWRYRILPDSVEIVELLSKTAAGVNVEELEEGKTNRKVVDVPRAIFGFPVTKLCDESFKNCSSITYLRIPQTVKEIGSGAFQNCTSLLALDSLDVHPIFLDDGHVTIPTGVRKLGNAPFEGTPIAQLSLPSTLTEIDGNPMRGCEFLATIEIADNNPNFSVVDNVLYDKRKTEFLGMPANGDIGSISLPSSTKVIGKGSFYGCKHLDSVNLPAILTTIGEDAFTGCSFLAELTVPASVTTIGNAAFSDCASLAKVTFEGAEPAAPDDIFDGSENVTVYGREENGWSGEEWKDRPLTVILSSEEPADTPHSQTINGITWHFRVVDGVAEIWNDGKVAVESGSPITSVTLPDALGGHVVKGLGDGALSVLRGLTSVSVPDTYEWIGDSAFSNCTSLASVTIPYGVRSIGKRPFVNTIITELTLPDSLLSMDGNIAAGSLFDLGNALSDSSHFLVTEDGAVYNKDQTHLYACPTRAEGTLALPESLTEIGTDAFFGCFRLTYLNIPASVTNIGETAFNVAGIWPGLDAPESSAKLQSIYFDGSAPSAAEDIFSGAPETLVNYAFSDDPNWTDPWKGRPITVIPDDAKPPILSTKDEFGITWYYRIRKGFVEICNEDANGNPIAAISPKSTSGQTFVDEEASLRETALRIPKSINGFAVTKIGDSAFDGCEGLTTIGIPGSVTEIGDHAFRGCKALKSIDVWDNVPWETTQGHINLPYGINKIGYRAFEGVQLQVLSLPDTVTELDGNPAAGCANLTTIEVSSANPKFTVVDGVLYNKRKTTLLAVPACLDISTVTLPASVTAIADESFCGCQYLDTIVLPSNLAAIGSGAFANCATLVKVTFEGVEPAAPDGIFDGSENVTVYGREENGWAGEEWKDRPLTVILSSEEPVDTTLSQTINGITWRFRVADGVAEIWNDGAAAVAGDNPPILSLTLPQALGGYVVKGIGDGALSGLRGLTSMSIPSTYEWIGDSAFSNCTSLAAVTIPEGVNEIGHWPFYGTALTELSIPDSVSAIDGNPVAGAAKMKAVKLSDAQPYFAADDGLLYNKDKSTLLACPATKSSISLPGTITTIGDDAFYGCGILSTIILPNGLAIIGSNAFANCGALAKVTFEGSVPTAPEGIFDGSESVTVYGREEDGWSGDTWKDRPLVVIPGGDDTALMQTVNGITWRFRVIDSVAEIWNGGATAVAGDNPPILSLTLPQALGGYVVKGIGDGALSGLRGLTSMSIPSTYEWIGDSAFSNCTSLAAVMIPEGVNEIGHWPFYGTALTELSIPDSVSAIDGNPVAGAAKMKAVKLSDAQPYFATDDGLLYDKDKSALLACPATKSSVSLPGTITTIGDDAFYGCDLLDGGKHTIDGVDWFYDITDTGAVVTDINGATNNVVIPKSLGGQPIVAIEPTAFNDCTGITGFSVKPDNTAFAAKNGALYSADGKTLIRVPDTYLLPAQIVETRSESSVSETIIPQINPDGTDGTTITQSVTPAKTTTSTAQIEPTVPMAQLLDGVAQIADFAFFGCGAGFKPSETVQTNDFTSETGFIDDTVFVRSTYTRVTVSLTKESVILIPEGIACGSDAFTGSGATEIRPSSTSTSTDTGASPDPRAITPETLDESSTYLGWISRNGIIDGSVTLKTAKMRMGVMKVSGSVQLIGEKKVSIKSLDAATPAGCELVIAKDVSRTGAFDSFKGKVITIALDTQDNGGSPMLNGCSTFTVTIAAKGKAKVSGYLADGRRVSVSAQMIEKDGKFLLPVFAPLYTGKKGGFAFVLDLSNSPMQIISMSKLVSIQNKTPYSVTLGILAVGEPAATISKGINFLEADLPTGYETNGQLIGWKPRYTRKSGLITGSLTVFGGTKKVKAQIYGIRVNDRGFGTAVIKNAGSWPVLLD